MSENSARDAASTGADYSMTQKLVRSENGDCDRSPADLIQQNKEKLQLKVREAGVFVALALVGMTEFLESLKYKILPLAKMKPGLFPAAIGILLFLASSARILQQWIGRGKETDSKYEKNKTFRPWSVREVVAASAVVLYLLTYNSVGFLLCTAVLTAVFMVMAGERRLIRTVAIGSTIALLTEFVFGIFLKIYLPTGILGINQFL